MSGIVLTTAIVGTILLLGGSGGIITWGGAGAAMLLLETLLEHVDSIRYLQSRLDGWTQDLEPDDRPDPAEPVRHRLRRCHGAGPRQQHRKAALAAGEHQRLHLQCRVRGAGLRRRGDRHRAVRALPRAGAAGSPSTPKTGTARWWASASWRRSRGRCSATSPSSPTPCPTPASRCPSSPPAAPA